MYNIKMIWLLKASLSKIVGMYPPIAHLTHSERSCQFHRHCYQPPEGLGDSSRLDDRTDQGMVSGEYLLRSRCQGLPWMTSLDREADTADGLSLLELALADYVLPSKKTPKSRMSMRMVKATHCRTTKSVADGLGEGREMWKRFLQGEERAHYRVL